MAQQRFYSLVESTLNARSSFRITKLFFCVLFCGYYQIRSGPFTKLYRSSEPFVSGLRLIDKLYTRVQRISSARIIPISLSDSMPEPSVSVCVCVCVVLCPSRLHPTGRGRLCPVTINLACEINTCERCVCDLITCNKPSAAQPDASRVRTSTREYA